jgi:hypothetical protein
MKAMVLLSVAIAALCGCSTPYLYQKEVGSFSSSVTAVADAVTQGFDTVDQDQAAADIAQVVGARTGVDLDPTCGRESSSDPCRVTPLGERPDQNLAGKFADIKPKEKKVVAALKAYADGLAAVTNAQDRKDYDAAASQLASSVASLGTALGAVTSTGAAAGPALSALVAFGTFTIGSGLDQARYDTLKSAINAVGMPSADLGGQSAIQIAANKGVTPAISAVRSARITLLFRQLNAQQDRINLDLKAAGAAHVSPERFDRPLSDLALLVATLNLERAVDPGAVGKSLVKAHDDLVKAVNDQSRQFESLVNSIADFAEKAAATEKAFVMKPATTSPAK